MAAKSKKNNDSEKSTNGRKYKEQAVPGPVAVASDDSTHRPQQPYSAGAPLRPIQQTRNINSTQPEQPQYQVSNVYNSQTGLQSPFLNNPSQFPPQQTQPDPSYYSAQPSPRNQHNATGPYYSADKPDSMAATATMQRPYPPIYNTPQSNSPASVTSPQNHDHGRPMYAQPPPQMTQPLYGYPQYPSMGAVHQPSYGGHHNQPQAHQMGSQSMLPYQSGTPQLPPGQVSSHHSTIASSPRLKSEGGQQYQQNPQSRGSMLQQQHPSSGPPSAGLQNSQPSGPNSTSNAAPGPIPATTPLVVRQDGNGVQWIAFEYSRDRVKMEYMIRCDVESVDVNTLSPEFKTENCVYPRACVPKDQYKGNRLNYETDCNQVGWALAELNTCLRGKRGLIQRAVDSWRNSNQDVRLRSRRVRRQAKMHTRNKMGNSSGTQPAGVAGPASAGHPGSGGMAAPSSRPTGTISSTPQPLHHHHTQLDVSPTGQEGVGGPTYSAAPQPYRQNSSNQHLASPNDLRPSHVFPGYQAYPAVPTTLGPSMTPPMQGGMHQLGRPGGTAAMASQDQDEREDEEAALYGVIPKEKRRKFILVEDTQKNSRVRVKVTLDQIEMNEVPDSFRKQNSVYPRTYYPVQMQMAPASTRGSRFADEEGEEIDDGAVAFGRASVPVQVTDGEVEIDVPRISKEKRSREEKINELGYRMAWGQGRTFSSRPIFLARALDAYRNKQRSALIDAGQEVSAIPAHLETRPGKRRWLERTRTVNQPMTPQAATSE